jgi:DNA mismatch repair protein PMS2
LQRLHDLGASLIEVIDDGAGVPPPDRPLLCAKHATSKLKNFDDLYSDKTDEAVCSFGFRGEALFSLSQLCDKVSFITRTAQESMGEYLEFDRSSTVVSKATKKQARERGTTVQVHNLFAALPVRRADFVKRIKSQRIKLFKMLQVSAKKSLGGERRRSGRRAKA